MHVYNNVMVANVVMNATITSPAFIMKELYGFAIQAVYTGTPTGTLKLQASADPATSINPGNSVGANVITNWTDIANTSTALSAAGNTLYNVPDVMYNWVRLVYTDGSGGTSTAVLSARFNAKGP